MSNTESLAAYFGHSRRNTALAWGFVGVLLVSFVGGITSNQYETALFSAVAIGVILAPVVAYRDPSVVPPWVFPALISLPILWGAFVPVTLATPIIPSVAVAAIALLLIVELDRFTTLRLVPWFAVVLTVLSTLAMSGLLNILRWSADMLVGTAYLLDGRTQDAINAAVMIEFIYATIAGIVAGAVFYWYFHRAASDLSLGPTVEDEPERVAAERNVEGVVLTDRLGISTRRQRQLVRMMQFLLVAMLLYGLWTRQVAVVTNATLGIVVSFIPALLERDYAVTLDPGLVLWITLAVFLHALGTAGLYDAIGTWDHLTHTLSATVVAAAGYATLRAIHLHSSPIYLPPWALFSSLIVFMLAISVIWEILEFFVDQGALRLDMEPILAQYGINDTIVDMLFNVFGAILLATWGTVYLTDVSDSLAAALEERFADR